MGNAATWIGKAAFVSFLLVVFSLGSMKPGVDSPAGTLTPTDLLFPLSLALFIAACVLDRRTFHWHPAFWMLILLLFTVGLAAVYSEDPDRSILKFAGSSYLVLLAFLAFNHCTSLHRVRMTIVAWIAGAAVPIFTGLVAVAVFYLAPETSWLGHITYHYGAVPVGYFPRVSSTMVSPSMLCNYLTVTIVLVLVSFGMGWLERKVTLVVVSMISFVCVFTVSIALGGIALAAGLWVWQDGHKRRRGVPILASVIAVAFIATAPFSMTDAVHGSIAPSSRLLVWSDAVETFLSDPVLGRGPGLPVANVFFRNSDGTASLLTDAHNMFLNVAAQTGLVGLIGLMAMILAVLRAGSGRSLVAGDIVIIRRGLLIAFVCAFLYDGLTGSFEDARHLWVLIGLIFAVEALQIGQPSTLQRA